MKPQNLREVLDSQGVPSEPTARRILHELEQELKEAHAGARVHVRVSPESVLLGARARLTEEWTAGGGAEVQANLRGLGAIASLLGVESPEEPRGLEEEVTESSLDGSAPVARSERGPADLLVLGDLMGAPGDSHTPTPRDGLVPHTQLLEGWGSEPVTLAGENWTENSDGTATGATSSASLAGQFRLHHRIGAGTSSEVYLATRGDTGERVAIKVLRPSLRDNAHMSRRSMREFDALRALQHPNIVGVLGGGQGADFTFVVLEYIQGASLEERLRRAGTMDMASVLVVAGQLADALVHAHSLGIIHRDLKPSNIMLASHEGRLQIKIVDFGLVRFMGSSEETKLTMAGTVGTPAYLAPEQIEGGEVGPVADLYALGGIIYRMIAGAPPFTGTVEAVLRNKRSAPAPALGTGTALDALVAELLELDPRLRPASAEVVLTRLGALRPAALAFLEEQSEQTAPKVVMRPVDGEFRLPIRALMAGAFVLVGLGLGYALGPVTDAYWRDETPEVLVPTALGPPLAVPASVVAEVAPSELATIETPEDEVEPAPEPATAETALAKERVRVPRGVPVAELRADVLRVLRKKNLGIRDLPLLELAGLSGELRELLNASVPASKLDPEEAKRLIGELREIEANDRVLEAKLDRVLGTIREAVAKRTADDLKPVQEVEDRYFRLRERVMAGLAREGLLEALQAASALERDANKL